MGRVLGELEQLLLLGLLRAGGDASGIDLRNDLELRTGRNVLPGAVYTIMERLRTRGLVSAYTGDATPERGGRRRKHYRLLPAGEAALARAYGQIAAMAEGVEDRLRTLLEES